MGRIVVLDQNMINMIAAGEVIERPASVVKELMENSLDAGASRITVEIEDGGRRFISVSDDGHGMDGEDLARAFESHATSKIRSSADLHRISTLGFRGEALASIASVAQIRAASRTGDSDQGYCIEIDCGRSGKVAPCSADIGTTIQVRDLFYKLPARRKFLRTANTEMGHISEQFTRIALANTHVALALKHNGREVCNLSGGQSLRERICRLFPTLLTAGSEDLIESRCDEKGMEVLALLGRPSASRTSTKFQYVFLNTRFIRDKFISHAIKEAYRGLLEPERSPVAFLFIRMPYEDYDVNVHPTKIEVRFCNANLVHSVVLGCLRERLLGTKLDIPGQIPVESGASRPTGVPGASQLSPGIREAMADFFKRHRPSQTQEVFEQLSRGRAGKCATLSVDALAPRELHSPDSPQRVQTFLQIHDSYIVEQTDDGFVIIDQHALHERVMYNALCSRLQSETLESQRLLIPETIELSEAESELLAENEDLLARLGIEATPFGPRSYAIQTFPTLLHRVGPTEFVRDLVDLLGESVKGTSADKLLDAVISMAACKGAIKAGQRLSNTEIEQLLADRDLAESSSRCPHGRPSTIRFTLADLERQFKRT